MDNKILSKLHSYSHIMSMVIKELYPNIQMGVGPAIENGFYQDYDFESIGINFTEEMLKDIEKKMKHYIKQNLVFEQKIISDKEALNLFKNDKYKTEIINDLIKSGETQFSIYQVGNYIDLCNGPHVQSTKELDENAFKLDRIAGAYWKGNEKNKMLTRIYGIAFDTKEELDKYLAKLEEAKKRDHRKIAKELDLYHIDEKVGLGLPLWHPKGAILWRLIEDFWYQAHLKNGYQLVRTPHIGSKILWETSGHWGFYNNSMYPPIEIGQTLEERQQNKKVEVSEEYLLKPMNCPFHVQIYNHNQRSYRDLPFRWAECGTVYRYEKKGELSGLTRVRGFTQDDAHIICREDQVEEELKKVIDFILFIFKSFGFDLSDIKVYLSLRDENNKDKYAGSDEGWDFTQSVLKKVATDKSLDFDEEIGEAAFYGPKLDFKIKDCLGRQWQCSTLQFDFNLPQRFDMKFINKDGVEERPYVLHRALFGSFERFIGLLIEHYNGSFPIWIAPIQIRIITVADKFIDYANEIFNKLKLNNIRVDFDDSNNSLSKKIRNFELQKIPYAIVIGENEIKNNTITYRNYKTKEQKEITFNNFLEIINEEIINKK